MSMSWLHYGYVVAAVSSRREAVLWLERINMSAFPARKE